MSSDLRREAEQLAELIAPYHRNVTGGWEDKSAVLAEIEAFARRMQAEAQQWQPIETAPNDGTHVLVWDLGRVVVANYHPNAAWEWMTVPGAFQCHPTYWMPLPSAKPDEGASR